MARNFSAVCLSSVYDITEALNFPRRETGVTRYLGFLDLIFGMNGFYYIDHVQRFITPIHFQGMFTSFNPLLGDKFSTLPN